MAGFGKKVPWTRQPQYPVKVDRSNPLVQGLVVTVNPPSGEAISGAQPAYYGTAARGPRKNGVAFVSGSTSTDAVAFALAATHPLYSITNDFTISIWIEPTSTGDYCNYFSVPYRSAGWTSPYNSLTVYKHTGSFDNTALQWASSSSTVESLVFSSQIITVGTASHANYIFTRTGSTCAAYKNGVLIESGTATGNTAVDWGEKRPIVLLNSSESSLPNAGYIGYQDGVDIWNRALSASEIAKYYNARYQIFEPLNKQLLVGIPAGGATSVNATPANATASGDAANLNVATGINATAANATASGVAADINLDVAVSATPANAAASGVAASLNVATGINATPANATATGVFADIATSAGTSINATPADATASGVSASLNVATGINATVADATAQGTTASVSDGSATNSGGYYIRLPDYRRKRKQPEPEAPKRTKPKTKRRIETYPDDTNQLLPYIPALFDVLAQRQAAQIEYRRMYNILARAALLAA